MRILVIGAGSMGRRRLRDLLYLNPGEVELFEPAAERCREVADAFGIRGFGKLAAALEEKPAALVVCTPPALHEAYVSTAIERGLHVFAEVPFVYDAGLIAEIAARAPSYPGVLGISHTIRYYPPYRLIRDLLRNGAIGKPLYIEYSLGNYLPDWHPYEDYRRFYAGDVQLGGAGMDMLLHEIGPIQWWLGPIASVLARFSKLSSLEIRGPDSHDILLAFSSGARGFFHHDLLERGTLGRHIRIAGEDGTIEWRQNQPAIRVYDGPKNLSREAGFEEAADWDAAVAASREISVILARQRTVSGQIPPSGEPCFTYESCYLREMRHFLDAALGRAPFSMASLDEEQRTLAAFGAIIRSNEARRELAV